MKNTLGDRMKEYEYRYRHLFPNRIPIIIRVDGRAFHSFTKGLKKPFDNIFSASMLATAEELVKQVQGCKLAYVQSDEVSLLLLNNDDIETEPWFNNNINKIVSLSASIATLSFNNMFQDLKREYLSNNTNWNTYEENLLSKERTATFDSRAFLLPEDEVNNYFLWRQMDASRNSILNCSQHFLGKKESFNHKCDELQDMMLKEKGFNWNNLPVYQKRGACALYSKVLLNNNLTRKKVIVDLNIPIFNKDTNYINDIVYQKDSNQILSQIEYNDYNSYLEKFAMY